MILWNVNTFSARFKVCLLKKKNNNNNNIIYGECECVKGQFSEEKKVSYNIQHLIEVMVDCKCSDRSE